MFELSYDGICSFQYAVPVGFRGGAEIEGLRTGFKDQPRLIIILQMRYNGWSDAKLYSPNIIQIAAYFSIMNWGIMETSYSFNF